MDLFLLICCMIVIYYAAEFFAVLAYTFFELLAMLCGLIGEGIHGLAVWIVSGILNQVDRWK